ncbi:hypothetical protein [Caenimonas koreensis]|uniref:Uncharacterized protein n=1 Tax=Caenimonas koreensis DSM 17982 TaxID=1121255 RepID=A0A844B334_9BURK|nr:hypothetical protein [Caenimonas koreensis]MRD45957.1 hypothetical protein [Caenimonas koreensis DSM 17982]
MLLAKTESGLKVMKDRSVALSPKQRAAFILVDGQRSLDNILAATAAMGVTRADIDVLFQLGLIADVAPEKSRVEQAQQQAAAQAVAQHKQRTPQERYAEAYPIATRLTSALGLRGFRLNLAVEGATNYEELLAVAPRILEAVGAEKFRPLDNALNDR